MQALLGLMLLTPLAANAADEGDEAIDVLVLKMADETTAEFALADEPTVSFDNGKFTVVSQGVTTDYEQSDVTEFYFSKKSTETGIGKAAEGNFSFVYNDNANVHVSGSKASKASLYTIDGKLVKSQKVNGGSVSVSLNECQPGMYVLNLENEHSFKIIKK